MKNKLLILVFIITITNSFGQVDRWLTGNETRICQFPDEGLSTFVYPKKKHKGAAMAFKFGDTYYIEKNHPNVENIKAVIRDFKKKKKSIVDPLKVVKDLTLGYNYNGGAKIRFNMELFENRGHIRVPGFTKIKIEKRVGYNQWENVSYNQKKLSSLLNKGWYTHERQELAFTPEPGGFYRITANFYAELRYEKKDKRDHNEPGLRMYLCVSGPGGAYGGRVYNLKINETQGCSKTNYEIIERKPGYTYYWSKSESTSNPNSSNIVPSGGIVFTKEKLQELGLKEGDDIYFFGVKGSYTTPAKKETLIIIDKPAPPIYTGDKYLCDCKTVFTAEPGEGGNAIQWKVKRSLFSPSLNSEDGVNGNGTRIDLTGVREQIIKNNGYLFLRTTAPVDGDPDGCKSDYTKINFNIVPCKNCGSNFILERGQKYVVSAWVKESNASLPTTYSGPKINFDFVSSNGNKNYEFSPTGNIIDGWQKIESAFTVPSSAQEMTIRLNCQSPNQSCYFDDIRIFNYNGSVVSYVYDPVTLQLSAKLDNNNMFVKYSYDEAGNLVSSKVETLDGVRTISESRMHIQTPAVTQGGN